nr:MAG TPA: hypothetical protein [Caudoviricetes sp.]
MSMTAILTAHDADPGGRPTGDGTKTSEGTEATTDADG